MMQDHPAWTGGIVFLHLITVCNVLKEDSAAVIGGSGWLSTFSKILDPRSNRKAYSMFVKRIFLLTLFSVRTTNMAEKYLVSRPERRNLVSRPGEKLTFEPTNNTLHSSFALLTTDAKKHNGV